MLSNNLIWSLLLVVASLMTLLFVSVFLSMGSYSLGVSPLETLYANAFGDCVLSWCLVSIICLVMLIVCGRLSLSFSYHYTKGGVRGNYLSLVMFVFLCAMMLLVSTGGPLTSLLMWEYLGLVSFILILCYGNSVSLLAALITMITSRVGDVVFFVLVCLWVHSSQFATGASYPFVPWLLEAMRAPTPVSALVHSSTLVAAGVWFSCCYLHFLSPNGVFTSSCLLLCVTTIFLTGVCALVFVDLKKIIALSTSNNVSWCLIFLILGDTTLCLTQLLSHGIAKWVLFILAGDLMSTTNGTQTYCNIYQKKGSLFVVSVFLVCLGLSGVSFLGAFFSKHLFLVSSVSGILNLVFCALIFLGQLITCAYTIRILFMCLSSTVSATEGLISVLLLSVLLWPLGVFLNACVCGSYAEQNVLTSNTSLLLYCCQLTGFFVDCLIHYAKYGQSVSHWFSELFGLESFNATWRTSLDYFLWLVAVVVFQWYIRFVSWCIPGKTFLFNKFSMSLTLFFCEPF